MKNWTGPAFFLLCFTVSSAWKKGTAQLLMSNRCLCLDNVLKNKQTKQTGESCTRTMQKILQKMQPSRKSSYLQSLTWTPVVQFLWHTSDFSSMFSFTAALFLAPFSINYKKVFKTCKHCCFYWQASEEQLVWSWYVALCYVLLNTICAFFPLSLALELLQDT